MLTGEGRTATVTSVTDTVLYEVRRQHIQDLMQKRPDIADSMTYVAAERRLRNEGAILPLGAETPTEEHHGLKTLILEKVYALFALVRH